MTFEIFLATGVFIVIMFIERIDPDSTFYPKKSQRMILREMYL